ncbi:MvdC/MvdD family ATP grasp protein [Leptolyngbya sp. AN02str]|uniref:MvdC/MvdD family ATP grasp protein n=1 Tax=Leptolyngbya sp. AN02str TaxID=3423363 RepID=UPI003D3223EF
MILIISSLIDVHAQAVIKELSELGVKDKYLLDLSRFPMQLDLSIHLNNEDPCHFALTPLYEAACNVEDVAAVWWRRPQPFQLPLSMVDPIYCDFAFAEANTAFQGMWQCSSALWVNNIVRDAAASHKPWQLVEAKKVGLSIPDTLMTNSPEEARQFWEKYPDNTVIFKAFVAVDGIWRETRRVRQEEKEFEKNIRFAPVIFQKYIEAVADLRITIVGTQIFAAEADIKNRAYEEDVRLNSSIAYKSCTLPSDIEQKLLSLMNNLGLEYGAIDMRVTPEGEYVFLEINPAGQFLYIENSAGLPISRALAEHLASGLVSRA